MSIPAQRVNRESIAFARFPPRISALSGPSHASVVWPCIEKSVSQRALAKQFANSVEGERNGSTPRPRGLRAPKLRERKNAAGVGGGWGGGGAGSVAGICGPEWSRSVGPGPFSFCSECAMRCRARCADGRIWTNISSGQLDRMINCEENH